MTREKIKDVAFTPPTGFLWGETTVSFCAPPPAAVRDPRILREQAPMARSNIVVNQRTTDGLTSTQAVIDDLTKRLATTVPSMDDLKVAPLRFADGAEGLVLSYQFPFGPSVLRQMHAVRLDGDKITTVVVTAAAALDLADERQFVEAIASVTVSGGAS